MAIGPERLTSRQEARRRAIQQERLDLIERRKRRRAARKRKKRRRRSLPEPLPLLAALIVDIGNVMCMAGFPGVAPRAVSFLRSSSPRCPTLGRYEPEGQLSVACAWLVLLDMMLSRCIPFYCRQALLDMIFSHRGDSNYTSVVFGRGYGHYWCRGPDSANRLEVPQPVLQGR